MQLDMFKVNHFHNSLPESEEKVIEYEDKAKKQDDRILKYFKTHRYQSFTPSEIYVAFGQQMPLTSVRRAITNLTKWGMLEMTENRRPGLYGIDNNCWKLKQTK